MASAALACFGAAEPAHAQFAYGAGATFPSVAYRGLMDCLYNQVQGSSGKPGPQAISPACPGFNSSGFGGVMIYAPTGSGNGKSVLIANNPTAITNPSASNTVPWTDSTLGVLSQADYDGVQFVGSDDTINPADIAAWNAAGNPAKYGNLIQLPGLIGPVAIGFNGKDGTGASLNILPSTPSGGSSGLNLSRNAMCGIFSGHITKWNNAVLTTLNGGVLGTGNITVVHRSDGSGTTFLFSNALASQCQFEFGPNSETDATLVSYSFPWTDRAATSCPFLPARGANQLNWPDAFGGTNQCGTAIANPGGGTFTQASGSGGIQTTVASTNGAIGYASADFWAPVKAGAPKTANIQSQWDLTAGTGAFQPPTPTGAQTSMSSATPVFDNTTRLNPLTWSLQGTVANPVVPGAYPIAGFTWLDMYQCYKPHANGNNAFLWFRIWLDYLYGSPDAHNILTSNGFAPVPAAWLNEIYAVLSDSTNGPNYAGSGGCVGKVGAN
jgi:ABC-type phosphate transport system substrate-binding protein